MKGNWRECVPVCLVGSSVDDAQTQAEAVHAARIQLDLIREGQDGTEDYTDNDIHQIADFIRAHQ